MSQQIVGERRNNVERRGNHAEPREGEARTDTDDRPTPGDEQTRDQLEEEGDALRARVRSMDAR